jgi:predicted transcriptional regulator
MTTATVRVTADTRATLQQLAQESNESMQSVVAKAVDEYKRNLLLRRTNEAYAALRARPDRWAEEQSERAAWEATLADDLENPE